jgi:hypothetical protein
MRAWSSVLPLLLCGCNDLLHIPSATPLEPDAPLPSVTGVAIDTYWQTASHMTLPRDLTQWQFSALVPNPDAAGGFDIYPGTGTNDGTFSIPGVPEGVTFMLKTVNPAAPAPSQRVRYYVGNSRHFDLGIDVLGRPNPAMTTQTTNLVLKLDNLQPYQDTDFLEVFCVNNAGSVFGFNYREAINLPDPGANTLAGTTFDWSQPYGAGSPRNPVINGDLGDTISIIQESSIVSPGGVNVQTIARVFTPNRFNQMDSATHEVSGSFVATMPSLALNTTFKRSLFEAHRAEINPKIEPLGDGEYGYGDSLLPAPNGHAQFGPTLDLLVTSLPAGTGEDVAFGEIHYGDPFPASWEHIRLARIQYGVSFSVDNGARTFFLGGRWDTSRNLEFGTGTLVDVVEPLTSPVRSPMVNGSNAFVGGTLSASKPVVVSWSPPSVGTPSRYWVVVFRAFNDAGKTRFVNEATLFTSATEATLPPELVPAGIHRIFVIYAQSSNDLVNSQIAPVVTDVWKVQ